MQSTSRLHALFQQLDTCRKQTLGPGELLSYGDGNYTTLFIDRVFEEHVCRRYVSFQRKWGCSKSCKHSLLTSRCPQYRRKLGGSPNESEMDIEEFLTFLLAVKNRTCTQSITYFFKILDVEKQGYITSKEILLFFRHGHGTETELHPHVATSWSRKRLLSTSCRTNPPYYNRLTMWQGSPREVDDIRYDRATCRGCEGRDLRHGQT